MKFDVPITAKQLAEKINAECIGDEEMKLTGLNEIHRVEQGDVTFCDNSKYVKKALDSEATCVLVNERMEAPSGKVLLLLDRPFKAFSELSKSLRGDVFSNEMISPSAVIGKGTKLMPNVFVGNNVTIGNDCFFHPNVTIYDGCTIGDNVTIQ